MAKIKSSQWANMFGKNKTNPTGIDTSNICLKYRTSNGVIKNGSPIEKTDQCIQFKR